MGLNNQDPVHARYATLLYAAFKMLIGEGMDIVTDEMRALRLPQDLVDRTLMYYEYLWNRHRTFDPAGSRFTEDLSPTLRTEILLHMNRDVIVHCSFLGSV